MNVVKEIARINERELELGLAGRGGSYHDDYKDSAYIFVGNLDYELTEGDVITIFSQFGEIVDVNLVRDKSTGKSKGFAFVAYEDQRSTVLAVDNFNGITLLGRTLRVDHTKNYKEKKRDSDEEEEVPKPRIAPMGILPGDEKLIEAAKGSDDDESVDLTGLDPEDPMYDYLVAERKRKAAKKKHKKDKKDKKKDKGEKKEKHKDKEKGGEKRETPVEGREESGRRRLDSPEPRPRDMAMDRSRDVNDSRERVADRATRGRSPFRGRERSPEPARRSERDDGDRRGDDRDSRAAERDSRDRVDTFREVGDRRDDGRRDRRSSRSRSPPRRNDRSRDRYSDRRDRSRDYRDDRGRRRSRTRSPRRR